MRIFAAAVYTSSFGKTSNIYRRLDDVERHYYDLLDNVLESYHYVHKDLAVRAMREDKRRIFLDSGAFSAWTQGSVIDMNAYCRYIKENDDILLHGDDGSPYASVLDAIGDPEGTFRNQKRMEKMGVKPLPCFHFGEDERYVDYYLKKYPYITLGGMVGRGTAQLTQWLDRIWGKYLCDSTGRARLKVHGFGLTSDSLMHRYPWYSVDSTTWQQLGSAGSIMFYDFDKERGWKMSMSNLHPSRKMRNQHYQNLPPTFVEQADKFLDASGFSRERLSEFYFTRWVYNLRHYTLMSNYLTAKDVRFFNKRGELF